MSPGPFVVGYVPGVMPGKWERAWRERRGRHLELRLVEPADQLGLLEAGELDMCLVRDLTRAEAERRGLHLVELYVEVPVVVASKEHPVSAYDEIAVDELAGEYQHSCPPLSVKDAVEAVAAGTGVVLTPMSLARLHHRKDVVAVPVTGMPGSAVGLAWRRDRDDEETQAFVGVVRGRTARSSRG